MRSRSTDGSGVTGLISGLIIWWLVLSEGGNTGSGAQLNEVGLSRRKQSLGMFLGTTSCVRHLSLPYPKRSGEKWEWKEMGQSGGQCLRCESPHLLSPMGL